MRHAVIMAGGAGTRLWPLSRASRPKHFLRFVGGRSLMRIAFERLHKFMQPEQINVITSAAHIDLVAEELPELPSDNIIGEPAVRDTANAVGLAAVLLHHRDPDGTMGVFTADHVITPIEQFQAAVETAYGAAEEFTDALVTFGITPTAPHTGYGYVRRGAPLTQSVHTVEEFREKPDTATAQRYVDSGEYLWNSGMFVWRTATILKEFAEHLPANHASLMRVTQAASQRETTIKEIYPTLDKISIDYGIMEKAAKVLITAMDCEWVDVGSWTALTEVMPADDQGHIMGHAPVVTLDSRNNIFVGEGDHLVATIGIENCVVVRANDATLVCHRDHVQKIKDLVEQLDERHR
jgi:mannose-1-phosphate guanylyltransferase